MAEAPRHMLDDLADEIVEMLTGEPEYYAELMRAGQQTPFRADIPQKDLLDVYQRRLYQRNPDGSTNWDAPNEAEHQATITRAGVQGYDTVIKQLMAKKIKEQAVTPVPSEVREPTSSIVGTYQPPEEY